MTVWVVGGIVLFVLLFVIAIKRELRIMLPGCLLLLVALFCLFPAFGFMIQERYDEIGPWFMGFLICLICFFVYSGWAIWHTTRRQKAVSGVSKPNGLEAEPTSLEAKPTGQGANVAGPLCYVLGWITGLIFLLLDKENKFVRFHALQSIVTFGAFTLLWIIFPPIFRVIPFIGEFTWLLYMFYIPSVILAIVLWIVLMVKAYQGEQYKLPWAGDLAERYA